MVNILHIGEDELTIKPPVIHKEEMVIEIPDKVKPDEICVICGFNITECEKKFKDPHDRGRQWARSFQVYDKWICGRCRDVIAQREDR